MSYIFLAFAALVFGHAALRGYRKERFSLQHGRIFSRKRDVFSYWFMLSGFVFVSAGCLALIILGFEGYVTLK